MKWVTRVAFTVLLLVVAFMASELRVAVQRSKQKRTMADMHNIADRIEKHQPIGPAKDAWGHPLRIHRNGPHYSIQAANSDGTFDAKPPSVDGRPVTTTKFGEDFLLMDGRFLQYPEGVCLGDEAGKGPLGDCMSCHPHRIRAKAS